MMHFFRSKRGLTLVLVYTFVVGLIALYRFYQPVTAQALTQFDIFDWLGQSKTIQLTGAVPLHNLWVFPLFNALFATLAHIDLFTVYLYGGAVVTTLAAIPLAGVVWSLTRDHRATIAVLFLYAVMNRVLARSVMYLPEAMTYLFGLSLLYFYICLFRSRRMVWLVPIWVVTGAFVFLHQSGLNFLAFSAIVTVLHVLFFAGLRARGKAILTASTIVGLTLVVALVEPIRKSLTFFFNQSNGSDAAFQGDAIPYQQFFNDFGDFHIILLLLGVVLVLVQVFRRKEAWQKLSLGVVLFIAFFYFTFLYILPNLNLYRLVPWRFYTWFSLYTLPLVGFALSAVLHALQPKRTLQVVVFAVLLYGSFHGSLVPDNMYTANKATLHDIEALNLPTKSLVVTTNANYLQTRYAMIGEDMELLQLATEVFKAGSPKAAHAYMQQFIDPGQSAYILVSKFQLQQRPYSIDYWRNSAIFDMNLNLFVFPYFETVVETHNIVLYRVRA